MATLDAIARDCSKPDWDGHGAHPIGSRAVANATRLLQSLSCEVDISPSPSGRLVLSFNVDGREIAVEVGDYTGSVDF